MNVPTEDIENASAETPPPCRFVPTAKAVPFPSGSAGVPHSWSSLLLSLLLVGCLAAMVHVVHQQGSMGLLFLVPFFLIYSFYFFIVVRSGGRNFREKLMTPLDGDPSSYVAALQRSEGKLWLCARCTSEVRRGGISDHETMTVTKYAENNLFPHASAVEQTPKYGLPPGGGPLMLHLSVRIAAADPHSQEQLDAARQLQRERCKGKADRIRLWEVYSLMPQGVDRRLPLQLHAKPRFEDALLYCAGGSMPWWCSVRMYWLLSCLMLHGVFIILFNWKVRGAWVCFDRALEVENA